MVQDIAKIDLIEKFRMFIGMCVIVKMCVISDYIYSRMGKNAYLSFGHHACGVCSIV